MLFRLVILLGVLLLSQSVAAVVIHRYVPSIAAPGGHLTVFGSGFGSWGDRRWKTVRIGKGSAVVVELNGAAIRHWTPHSIGLRLPTGLTPGVYWVGIYDRLGRLLSNRTPALRIQNRHRIGK